jgi:hypothetical protein
VSETLFPIYGLSEDAIRLVITLLAIGFPIVLIISWVFELTPQGLKLERNIDRFTGHSTSRACNTGRGNNDRSFLSYTFRDVISGRFKTNCTHTADAASVASPLYIN